MFLWPQQTCLTCGKPLPTLEESTAKTRSSRLGWPEHFSGSYSVSWLTGLGFDKMPLSLRAQPAAVGAGAQALLLCLAPCSCQLRMVSVWTLEGFLGNWRKCEIHRNFSLSFPIACWIHENIRAGINTPSITTTIKPLPSLPALVSPSLKVSSEEDPTKEAHFHLAGHIIGFTTQVVK